MKKRGSGPP